MPLGPEATEERNRRRGPSDEVEPRTEEGHDMSEMYFSVDVESNGPVPGLFSMLSIGITALHPETLEEIGHFYQKLKPLPDAREDPDTMKFWSGFPEMYAEATSNARDPLDVMRELDDWVRSMTSGFGSDRETRPTPLHVAYPVAFDFGHYNYYAWRFAGRSVFGFVGLDMGSLAMGHNGDLYDHQTKKKWPTTWVEPEDRVAIHHALLDARQQADIFRRQMKTICPRFASVKESGACSHCGGTGYDPDPQVAGHEGACSQCDGHGRERENDVEFR
jgi:hypothetical protein